MSKTPIEKTLPPDGRVDRATFLKLQERVKNIAIWNVEKYAMSSGRVRDKLIYKKRIPDTLIVDGEVEEVIEPVISHLVETGVFNDLENAKELASREFMLGRTEWVVRKKLQEKRFSDKNIEEALDYARGLADDGFLFLAERTLGQLSRESDPKKKERLFVNKMSRNGHHWSKSLEWYRSQEGVQ